MRAEEAATQAAEPAGLRSGAAATEQQLMLARLGVDLRRLKDIQSIERKIELKRELLSGYAAWVDGILAADTGAHDDVLTHVLIWRIDTGDVEGAMPLIRHVLRHDLSLPERFDRTAPTYICEEMAESAIKRLGQGPALTPDELVDLIAILTEIDDLLVDADVFDQVRAKLEKALGLAFAAQAEAIPVDADGPAGARRARLEQAAARLRRALQLDDTCGVKTRLAKLERAIAGAAE